MFQNEGSALLSLIGMLFIFVFVLFLAYLTTRLIGKHSGFKSAGKSIKILERVSLGQDKSLAVVAIGDKGFILGITGQTITNLGEADLSVYKSDDTACKESFGEFKKAPSSLFSETLSKLTQKEGCKMTEEENSDGK